MRHKFFLLAACIFCLICLLSAGYRFDEPGKRQLSVQVVSVDTIQAMLEGAYEEYAVRPTLYFDGHMPAYDKTDDVYYITQCMDKDSFCGVLNSSEGTLYWQEDAYFQTFRGALAEGHLFSLYCVDERAHKWCRYRIVFSGMPTMMIDTRDGREIKDRNDKGAMMRLFDLKFPGREYVSSSCKIKIRGGTSKAFDKKGYRMTLDGKRALLGMREDDDWILTALYDDSGLIHNKFSYDVWRDIASDNSVKKDDGTTMEYVEMFCNDTYLGVYGVVERIDAKELSLRKSNDILYKCKGYDLPEEQEDWLYILEQDYCIKYPKEHDSADWAPLEAYLEAFTREEGIADYEQAVSLLNMENAIDHNLFILLSYGCDNYKRKNTFYLADWGGNENPGYTIIKVPWDCNATWGNYWVADEACNDNIYGPETITDPNLWSEDVKALFLCRPDEIGALTRERWAYLRQDILSDERLVGRLNAEFSYLHDSGAYDRNYRRWPNGTEYWDDNYIYEYVEGRLQYLDDYFEDPYLDENLALDY